MQWKAVTVHPGGGFLRSPDDFASSGAPMRRHNLRIRLTLVQCHIIPKRVHRRIPRRAIMTATYCGRLIASCSRGHPAVCRCCNLGPKNKGWRERPARRRKFASHSPFVFRAARALASLFSSSARLSSSAGSKKLSPRTTRALRPVPVDRHCSLWTRNR